MRVAFACGGGGPAYNWADPEVELGIGGSEECVILLSRALCRRGHEVTVYNNCGEKAGVYHGVRYRHYLTDYSSTDLLVAWRDWSHLIDQEAGHKWLWCHDIPVSCHCPSQEEIDRPDSAFNHIDTFVLLNQYHRNLYARIPDDKVLICPIGIEESLFNRTDIARIPGRVLYFSHPHRGLDQLRAVWPQVRASVPEATLAAFWWEPEFYLPSDVGLGILPMQKLGYREIAVECLKAGIFGYPSVFAPEISPATTIKAQAGGAVPVVVLRGGMVDTVHYGTRLKEHDFFAQELISALVMSQAGDLEGERVEMMAWAQETYSWDTVAETWENHANRGVLAEAVKFASKMIGQNRYSYQ